MIRLSKIDRHLGACIHLPGSKSISNRLLILRHLYGPSVSVSNLSASDDTVLLHSLLTVLEQYHKSGSGTLRLDARNCGTAFRFLTALLAITPGQFMLTGSDRMKMRPIGHLVDALRDLGADIEYLDKKDHPPLLIRGRKLEGGQVRLNLSLSSQFLSALLLIAPKLDNGLQILREGEIVSGPYAEMTVKLLRQLGAVVEVSGSSIQVRPKGNLQGTIAVEPDWSSASFWYTMLSLADQGRVEFPGLHFTGLQGDEILERYYRPLGIESEDMPSGVRIISTGPAGNPETVDFSSRPDTAMPVILAHAARSTGWSFTGLDRLKYKESDRVMAMEREFAKVGLYLHKVGNDAWRVEGDLTEAGPVNVEDDEDHRIAMTMACLAIKGFQVHFRNRDVVSKSYPGFWKDLLAAGFEIIDPC
jgi:3-phosphoshikimate 1-carboxyvinyltransferase